MVERRLRLDSALDGLAVQIALQYGFHTLVRTGIQGNGPACSRLQTLRGVLLAQPQNAEAGAVALFGVAFGRDDALKQIGGRGTCGFWPSSRAGKASIPNVADEPWADVR
jgi:hypothetical protein